MSHIEKSVQNDCELSACIALELANLDIKNQRSNQLDEAKPMTAFVFLPLYRQAMAEALAFSREMERRLETQADFDDAAFELEFLHPVWARKSALASMLFAAPVVTNDDLIAKAIVVAEDTVDGIADKTLGARLLRDCMAALKQVEANGGKLRCEVRRPTQI